MRTEIGQHAVPFIEIPIYSYFFSRRIFRLFGHTFEAPDIGYHLVVVIIAMPALHRFNVFAMFLAVLIWKSIMLLLPFLKPPRYPFVPSRDKYQFGIQF